MNFPINKWQRLLLATGAFAFLAGTFAIWHDENSERSPELTFVVFVALTFFALGPKRSGEEALPFANWMKDHWKVTTATFAAIVVMLAIALATTKSHREGGDEASLVASDTATDVAPFNDVEMPSEEALWMPPNQYNPNATNPQSMPKEAAANQN